MKKLIYTLKLLRYQKKKMASEQNSDFIRKKQQSFNLIRQCIDLRKYKTQNSFLNRLVQLILNPIKIV